MSVQVGTLSADAIPEAGHQPCMVAIGNPEEDNLSVVVYADCVPLFSGPITEAVPVLVAAYFVFDAQWPVADKLTIILLSAIVVPEKMKSEIAKKKSVLAILEAIGASAV